LQGESHTFLRLISFSLVVATVLLEGLGRQLDPELNLLAIAKPFLLHYARKLLRANEQ
jgi:predicted unusual protein kinase regulating ubiquinone biosynthesis (AarF/ABC1/UbiB family)